MSLEGKRILVTGGTGGLGRCLVPRLIEAGAWVAVTYRSNEELAELFERLDQDAPQPKAVSCDLTDADSVERLADEIRRDMPLQGLACLAGGWAGGKPLWETDPSQLHEMVRTNLLPTWRVLQRFVGGMVEAGEGRIVTVAARQAVAGMKGNAAYSAAKAGVVGMTQSLAQDVHGTGVSVACVLPSSMRDQATPGINTGAIPYDRVAALVTWLMDDEASVTNGALIPAYGD